MREVEECLPFANNDDGHNLFEKDEEEHGAAE